MQASPRPQSAAAGGDRPVSAASKLDDRTKADDDVSLLLIAVVCICMCCPHAVTDIYSLVNNDYTLLVQGESKLQNLPLNLASFDIVNSKAGEADVTGSYF